MKPRSISAAALLLAALGGAAFAQSAYEIQVYPSETAAPGATFLELHSNTALRGPPDGPGNVQPDLHSFHETLEVTRGFSDWFETGFYVFSSARSGEGWQWAGDHVRPRVRVPPSWGWPFGASLSAEIGYFQPAYADSRWDLELRPILDYRAGRFYVSLNPALDRVLRLYRAGTTSMVFAPSAKASCDLTRLVSLGLEYYGSTGPLERTSPAQAQQHQLFPVVDLAFSPDWEFNAGAGFGLTRATDGLVVKLILGRRFAARP